MIHGLLDTLFQLVTILFFIYINLWLTIDEIVAVDLPDTQQQFNSMSSTVVKMSQRTNKWDNDNFALTFSGKGNQLVANQILYHSALHYIDDVQNRTLLDIACAEGHFCRLIKCCGALRVMGVDISPGFLDYARQEGGDCEYQFGNGFDLGVIDQFDFVTANRFLTYAETVGDLKAMCCGFYNNLKPGGRFIGLGYNCLNQPFWDDQLAEYGIAKFVPLPPTAEAQRIEAYIFDSQSDVIFRSICFYFDPHVYEEAFRSAGFRSFRFEPIVVDQSIIKLGRFWNDYLQNPNQLCYIADK